MAADLIKQITDYVVSKENPVRERIGAVMGGKILQLASERLIEEGRTQGITEGRSQGIAEGRSQGIEEGRVKELYSMVQDGGTTPEYAAKRLQITVSELRQKMLNDGYQFPEN